MSNSNLDLPTVNPVSEMRSLGRFEGYVATAQQVADLPDYYAAVRQRTQYRIPVGRYVGRSLDGLMTPVIVDIYLDAQTQRPRETWSRVRIVEQVAA